MNILRIVKLRGERNQSVGRTHKYHIIRQRTDAAHTHTFSGGIIFFQLVGNIYKVQILRLTYGKIQATLICSYPDMPETVLCYRINRITVYPVQIVFLNLIVFKDIPFSTRFANKQSVTAASYPEISTAIFKERINVSSKHHRTVFYDSAVRTQVSAISEIFIVHLHHSVLRCHPDSSARIDVQTPDQCTGRAEILKICIQKSNTVNSAFLSHPYIFMIVYVINPVDTFVHRFGSIVQHIALLKHMLFRIVIREKAIIRIRPYMTILIFMDKTGFIFTCLSAGIVQKLSLPALRIQPDYMLELVLHPYILFRILKNINRLKILLSFVE